MNQQTDKRTIHLFNHYFKIVLGKNTIDRYSVVHSDKTLKDLKIKKYNKYTLKNLFECIIKPYETWIFKKVIETGIDLSELDFDNLIYHLAFEPYHHKATLDYMLQVAKDNNIRLFFKDDNKTKTNAELVEYVKNETDNDLELSINQLIKYIEQQEDISI